MIKNHVNFISDNLKQIKSRLALIISNINSNVNDKILNQIKNIEDYCSIFYDKPIQKKDSFQHVQESKRIMLMIEQTIIELRDVGNQTRFWSKLTLNQNNQKTINKIIELEYIISRIEDKIIVYESRKEHIKSRNNDDPELIIINNILDKLKKEKEELIKDLKNEIKKYT